MGWAKGVEPSSAGPQPAALPLSYVHQKFIFSHLAFIAVGRRRCVLRVAFKDLKNIKDIKGHRSCGAPGPIRTAGPRGRNPLLCPTELRGQTECMEARPGVEPGSAVLQTAARPLCYRAKKLANWQWTFIAVGDLSGPGRDKDRDQGRGEVQGEAMEQAAGVEPACTAWKAGA